ncbi:hypothetical protein BYT27DRAFT_7211035 [Phlegmacium glaucopus]|nr:hypothetical protein BYT27DRAFT_7211035 [Phlegmacium glaucopus]
MDCATTTLRVIGKDFKKLPPINPEVAKDGHLQLLFFEAERAWAYAQELTTSSLHPANDDKSRSLRHSATGRFRRAVNWSTQLLSLCQTLFTFSRLSAENLIEVTIYTVILHGRFLRYRDDFEDALIQLSVARGLLDDLVNSASTSRDQALAILFSDEIGPEIRYCAHELGRAKAYDVNGIVTELAPKHRNQLIENCDALIAKLKAEQRVAGSKLKLKERLWDGQPIPVRYPELVDVLLKVEEAEVALEASQKDRRPAGTLGKKSKLGVTAYDALLLALSDTEEVARKLEGVQQLNGTGASSSPSGGRDIHFVHAYILYQLLSRRIQRDLLLKSMLLASESGDKSKAQENKKRTVKQPVDYRLYPALIKLLDTVLQSLTQMRTLTIVDDYPDLASAVEARISFTNVQRCVYLAQCYSAVKKYAEGLALLQHASIHIRETISNLSLSELDLITNATPSFFPLKIDEVKEFESTVASESLQFKRDWFAYNGGSLKTDPTAYKKPLFFNIALNYVELDMDRLQERTGKKPIAPSTSGAASSKAKSELAPEKKQNSKAKVEEHVEPAPQPQPQARAGLSSLLGGWWSKTS